MILNSKKDSKLKIIWKQKWIRITTYILLSLVAIFLVFNKSITNYLVRSYQPIINRSTIQNANKSNGKNDYASVKKLTLAQIARARVNAKNIPIVGQICIPDDGIYQLLRALIILIWHLQQELLEIIWRWGRVTMH